MAGSDNKKQPGKNPVAIDIRSELAILVALNIDELRQRWRRETSSLPPGALSKDLLARALAHRLQEQVLGGVDPRVRRQLKAVSELDAVPVRHVKIGSVIVREHQGQLHEVLVVPDGFCWQGKVYASLSAIAKKITGTSWNGPRFFGLRGAGELKAAVAVNTGAVIEVGPPRSMPMTRKLKLPPRRIVEVVT